MLSNIETISSANSVSTVVGAPKLRPLFTASITDFSISVSQ